MSPYVVYGAIVTILLLTGLNAFFTLAETALVVVRKTRLQQLLEEGAKSGSVAHVQELIREPTRVFATVQVGITLTSFTVAALAISILAPGLQTFFIQAQHGGVALSIIFSHYYVVLILVTLVFALFTITVGELVPRAIALRHPERVALRVAVPLRVCITLLAMPASIALGLSNLIVKPFGLTATFATPVITEEELRTLIEAGAQSGAIEEEEKEIIRNVISFADTDVRQVMTPRIDVKAVDVTSDLHKLLAIIMESGHSRIPVYEGSVDTIIGVVHAKDLLPLLARGEQTLDLRRVARQPIVVPENKSIDAMLDEFRRSNIHLAIVQDEYGGTAGIVTIEDLLEEIVGEIGDEYDREEPLVRVVDAHTTILDGRMVIDDVNELMGTDFPQDDFDTLGGFVFGLFGHQPVDGETTEYHGTELTAIKTDGRRVQQVKLRRMTDAELAAAAAEAEEER